MFSISFKEKSIRKYSAIINMSSSMISTALLNYYQEDDPQIQFYNKKELDNLKIEDFNLYIKNFFNTLSASIKEIKKAKKNKITHIDCFLPSFLTISQSLLTTKRDKKGYLVDDKILKDLVKKNADDILQEEAVFSNILGDENMIIEKLITGIKMNNYFKSLPLPKQVVNKLEVYQYYSLSSTAIINKIKEIVTELEPRTSITFHTFPVVAKDVFQNLLPNLEKGFVAIDITGGTTDLSFIKKECISHIISLPKGKNYFLNRMASINNSSLLDTISELKNFKEGKLEKNRANKIRDKYLEIGQEWLGDVYKAFDSVVGDIIIPEKIILTGDNRGDKIFVDFLKKANFAKYILGDKLPEIIFMDKDFLADLYEKPINVTIKDILLPLEIYFIQINNK